jgi:hypothetical protein
LRAPAFVILLLLGKVELRDALLPLERIWQFVLSARATATLIALNVCCFAIETVLLQKWPTERFLATFAFSPQALWQGRFLPLLLHVFAHASLPHLLSNMLALFVFGRVVEGCSDRGDSSPRTESRRWRRRCAHSWRRVWPDSMFRRWEPRERWRD